MANPRLIKKRVDSIKNIGKITKALEMVSASKVKKAQNKALAAKPYARIIYDLVRNLSGDPESSGVPLMRIPENENNDLFVLITTNRGLAGSLNTNFFRSLNLYLEGINTKHSFVTIGKKGRNQALLNGRLEADFSDNNGVGELVSAVAKIVITKFLDEECDKVYLAYNDFVNAMTQEPVIKTLLPITREQLVEAGAQEKSTAAEIVPKVNYTYEPSVNEVLNDLLPYYVEVLIAESLYEAEASEHSARMMAMKNASDNAAELTQALSLEYNKERQSLITTEISDITTAQAAIKK